MSSCTPFKTLLKDKLIWDRRCTLQKTQNRALPAPLYACLTQDTFIWRSVFRNTEQAPIWRGRVLIFQFWFNFHTIWARLCLSVMQDSVPRVVSDSPANHSRKPTRVQTRNERYQLRRRFQKLKIDTPRSLISPPKNYFLSFPGGGGACSHNNHAKWRRVDSGDLKTYTRNTASLTYLQNVAHEYQFSRASYFEFHLGATIFLPGVGDEGGKSRVPTFATPA